MKAAVAKSTAPEKRLKLYQVDTLRKYKETEREFLSGALSSSRRSGKH